MRTRRSPVIHDVIVIGSGAAGGMAAWNLTRQGVNVLLLDAGTRFAQYGAWAHVKPWEARARLAQGEQQPDFFLNTEEQPYLSTPGQPFDLYRIWGRGGKTAVWGRVSLRFSDLDFTAAERDGWGMPWPIRYRDIASYYDQVEQLVGVCGGDEDLDVLPGSKYLLPPPAPRCGERLLQKAAAALGIATVPTRRAVLTQPWNGREACHYCGACGGGCEVGAFFNAADHLLEPALGTGRLTIIDQAVAARVLTNEEGRAKGVQYSHRVTREEQQVYGRVVVVAASCIDSTRILLNSRSAAHPNGLGNGSDVIGRYLVEQIRFGVSGFVPELRGTPARNDDGIGGEHIYLPRFNHRDGRPRDYLRGFGIQFWNTGAQANAEYAKALPGFGLSFKQAVRERYPALVSVYPFGEVLPRPENRVTVDDSVLDQYGVPLACIQFAFGENERLMARDAYETAEALLHEARGELLPYERDHLDRPGSSIHEAGTCRMGDDPRQSALNAFNQMHEVPNVFVVDASAFSSATEKNPTLTILALAWRATDFLAEELRTGRL